MAQTAADGEGLGLGASLESFKEAEEVLAIVQELDTSVLDPRRHELAVERFKHVLDWYQEQPHLLDPHIEPLLRPLVELVRLEQEAAATLHATAALVAHLFKVRGPKVVVKFLPHEVDDLERVVSLLQRQDPADPTSWETRYILLLWLSIIAMIPFDIARFDSGAKEPLAGRLVGLTRRYLASRDKCRDAAAALASTLLTRPDTRLALLPAFLDWAVGSLAGGPGQAQESETTGALTALCAVVKHGKREDLLAAAPSLLAGLLAADLRASPNTNIRKLRLKLVQRLGLVFLRLRVAAWRYQRGSRSLAATLGDAGSKDGVEAEGEAEEEDYYDVPETIEDVIEELLVGLRDKDTVVRWSAAKGVGRVTGRLPRY